jgi:tetratricopeptide (TPR) repeat protein
MNSPVFQGTVFATSTRLGRRLWWNADALQAATPVARFGNLFIFRGNFELSGSLARTLYFSGIYKEYAEKPDLAAAEHLFAESVQADPGAFFVYIELGNLALKRGSREDALRAYNNALLHAPSDPLARKPIEEQIARFSVGTQEQIPMLRNPQLE